jgi:hypothetical protein
VRLNYYWTDCEDGSHVAVNYTVHDDRVSGSVRRWTADLKVNVGRKFEVAKEKLGRDAEGGPAIVLEGVCAGAVVVPLDAGAVREAGLEWNRAA